MTEKYQPIPHRLKNMAVGGHVAGAVDILDDNLNRNQQDINADTYRKAETYSKEQLNNMITTPEQKYENYTATDETTDVTDLLPAEGEADTTYRVGSWDGAEYNASKFSEYSWDGTQYLLMKVQSPGIDTKAVKGSSNLIDSGAVRVAVDDVLPGIVFNENSVASKKLMSSLSTLSHSHILRTGAIDEDNLSNYYVKEFGVSGGEAYIIQGRIPTKSNTCMYAFYDTSDNLLTIGALSGASPENYTTIVKSPTSAAKLLVSGHAENGDARVYEVKESDLNITLDRYYVAPYGFYDSITGEVYVNALYKNGTYITGTNAKTFTLSSSNKALVFNPGETEKIRAISDYPSVSVIPGDILLLRVSNSLFPLEGKLLEHAIESMAINTKFEGDTNTVKTIPQNSLTQVVADEITTENININGEIETASGNRRLSKFAVTGGDTYVIKGHVGSRDYRLYAFYDGETLVSVGDIGNGSSTVYEKIIVAPDSADTLYIGGNRTIQLGSCAKFGKRDIYPYFIYEAVSRSTGEYSHQNYGKGLYATPRYIKNSRPFMLTTSIDCAYSAIFFDKDYAIVSSTDWESILQNTPTLIIPPSGCEYMKIEFRKSRTDSSYPDVDKVKVKITGDFDDCWDTFNPRPADEGYQKIVVHVNLTNPTCCDDITDDLQDQEVLSQDYGLICLPPQYTNTGKPTRLIIYCHGAAVNYDSSVARFDSTDLEPDYWLAEGYAVMDVEGNPFNNTDEHFYIPQAMESYIAAYKWAIEHFNLRRDGVFLGGRSMGGGNTFNLLRRECPIPVIAACPNVPAINTTLFWNYMSADRRQFCANHMGFVNQPTWSGTSPMPSAQWNCLKENFDKLVKYSPAWNIITDLPDKEVLLASNLNISKSTSHSDVEEAVYGKLHASVKAPVKLFGCLDDTTCPVDRTSRLYYRMLLNSGQIAELRLFNEGGHHYDTQNENLRTTVTTHYGEELEDISVVYIEMLQFWRRYEQMD